ncbi:Do family serine endopeptidase [Vaginella massiliensis]|uniref:Do family serine endopeptidase n=1 Tax=Vaginella massiliensis TaxID=1816680 RepID=UPI000838C790|nr:Do family serine endopeptidase [Vaginella massiliensis]
MKKYTNYLLVGLVSSVTTLGGFYTINNLKDDGSTIVTNASNKDANGFKFVDYSGNYSYNAPDFVEAANRSVNTVVAINNYQNQTRQRSNDPFFDFFFGFPNERQQRQQENQPAGSGSGVIISADGYIVTNNHVIKGANKIEVKLNNQKTYTADLIGTDPSTDIALLKIEEKGLPYVKFIDSDNINVGDWVLAVGNPFGLNSTVTAGIISAKGRSINILRQNSDSPVESFIQTDAAINPGNSGGALVNVNGDLIGINTAISSPTGTYAGYGFAVPSNLVKKVVEDIKKYGLVQRGYLGIQGFDLSNNDAVKEYNSRYNKSVKSGNGVYVTDVVAKGSGIEVGDVITEVDGKPIGSMTNLTFIIGSKRPGDKVNVTLNRNGKTRSLSVTLRDAKGNTELRSKADLTPTEILGADFEPLTERQKDNFGLNYGVIVKNLKQGKLATAGIREDFIILKVNDKEVKNAEDINKILKNHKGRVSINFIDYYGQIYTRGFNMD